MSFTTLIATAIERLMIGALFVLAATVATAAAETIPKEAMVQYQTFSEAERVRTLINLAKSGQQDVALQLLQQVPLQGDHSANRTLYIEGLILRADGKLTAATAKFRAALADDPKLTLVRSDLAETLYALEQDDSAKHHLKLLEAEAPDEQAALGIRSFIEEIDTRRPYTINAYVALAPTSNINSGTRKKTVYSPAFGTNLIIDDASREKGALGVAVGVNGSFNRRLGDDIRAIISGNIEARVYDDSDYNSLATSQAFELRRTYAGGHFSFGAVSSQDFSVPNQEMSYFSYGPRIALEHGFTPQDYINASALFEWRDYSNSDDQNAEVLTLNTEFTHAFDLDLHDVCICRIHPDQRQGRHAVLRHMDCRTVRLSRIFRWRHNKCRGRPSLLEVRRDEPRRPENPRRRETHRHHRTHQTRFQRFRHRSVPAIHLHLEPEQHFPLRLRQPLR